MSPRSNASLLNSDSTVSFASLSTFCVEPTLPPTTSLTPEKRSRKTFMPNTHSAVMMSSRSVTLRFVTVSVVRMMSCSAWSTRCFFSRSLWRSLCLSCSAERLAISFSWQGWQSPSLSCSGEKFSPHPLHSGVFLFRHCLQTPFLSSRMPYLLFGLLHSLHLANLLPPTKALHGSFLYLH